MAKRKSQSDHDKLVKKIADFFIEKKEPNVKADITGYPSPKEIMWKGNPHGHIPDVTSNNEKQYKYIVEVETDDSINDSHTSDQWKLFSAFAKENSAKFIIVVPKGSKVKAEERAKELSVTGEVAEL